MHSRTLVLLAGLLVFWLALAACKPGAPNPEKPAASFTPESIPTLTLPATTVSISSPATVLTPSPLANDPTATPDLPKKARYELDATLNYALHRLNVEEKITYSNNSSEALPDLLLMVDPLYYPNTFQLNSLKWGDGQPVEDFTWEVGQLRIQLPDALPPGGSVGLALSYELNLPSPVPSPTTRPVPFGYTARQTNLVDWYPFIPPYVPGQGWLAHEAGYFGEHLVYDESDFQVNIQILDQRTDLTVAASVPAEIDGSTRRYQMDDARNFVWSVSPEYQVLTQTVGTTTVVGYAFSFHALAGKAALETTAEALDLYNRLYAPYPRQMLSVVEADFLDGMEYDGLYFLSDGFYNLYTGTPGEYLVSIAAHETAHQWWYALVGSDQALEPWLDEAMSTYSERLFYENVFPQSLDWWWQYRVDYYDPQGWVNGSIYNPNGYRAYRDAVYLNGAHFLEDLRQLIGDKAFFDFLRDYARQEAHQIATAEDFFRILRTHTQVDLTPLLAKYFQPK
jgi:hypothetical protein